VCLADVEENLTVAVAHDRPRSEVTDTWVGLVPNTAKHLLFRLQATTFASVPALVLNAFQRCPSSVLTSNALPAEARHTPVAPHVTAPMSPTPDATRIQDRPPFDVRRSTPLQK
jgi:hypothetical protein